MSKKNEKTLLESSLKVLAKTSMVVFIGVLLSKVFTYAYRILIARYFGPEEYGLFSLAFMILGFFTALSSLGLIEGVLRYLPIYRGKEQKARTQIKEERFDV